MVAPSRPRVVILDDEQRAREMRRRCLDRYGYEAIETETVRAAIGALREGTPSAAGSLEGLMKFLDQLLERDQAQ